MRKRKVSPVLKAKQSKERRTIKGSKREKFGILSDEDKNFKSSIKFGHQPSEFKLNEDYEILLNLRNTQLITESGNLVCLPLVKITLY